MCFYRLWYFVGISQISYWRERGQTWTLVRKMLDVIFLTNITVLHIHLALSLILIFMLILTHSTTHGAFCKKKKNL